MACPIGMGMAREGRILKSKETTRLNFPAPATGSRHSRTWIFLFLVRPLSTQLGFGAKEWIPVPTWARSGKTAPKKILHAASVFNGATGTSCCVSSLNK